MRGTIKKWGNGPAVRIPSVLMQAASLGLDSPVDIREEGGAIVIRPIEPKHELANLVAKITPGNIHAELETGVPVGKEIWL